jgi:hypothetical protein
MGMKQLIRLMIRARRLPVPETERKRIRKLLQVRAKSHRHAGRPDLIINEALAALGQSTSYLFDLLEIEEDDQRDRFTFDRLGAFEWVAICNALYLNVDCYSYGYSRLEHRARISAAIDLGTFRFPWTLGLEKILCEIRIDWWREFFDLGRRYGSRLRWKVRMEMLRTSWNRRRLCHLPLHSTAVAKVRWLAAQDQRLDGPLPDQFVGEQADPEFSAKLNL